MITDNNKSESKAQNHKGERGGKLSSCSEATARKARLVLCQCEKLFVLTKGKGLLSCSEVSGSFETYKR